ncbi:MAG: aldose 1-epimerase [Planctomyces sp.]
MNIAEIHDAASGSVARIATDVGFNCFRFLARINENEQVDVIDAVDGFENGGHQTSHYGIPILFPFPNRIRGGKYSWNGKSYQIPTEGVPQDGIGNAIHGFCMDLPWRIINQTASSVTGEFQLSKDAPNRLPYWPTDCLIRIKYSVRGTCLRADIEVQNPSQQPLPWGFGTHAYFRLPLSKRSEKGHCTAWAPVRKVWKLDRFLPTGVITDPPEGACLNDAPYLDTLKLDDVYTDVVPESGVVTCRITDERAGLKMEQRCSADFREIVAFTPPWSDSVCLEPYTCVTDAINLQNQGVDAGWRVLAPGASWLGWIEIDAMPVVC